VDTKGESLPWYTYPAIDFLSKKRYKDRHILEWGAGYSSLWWAKRAASVTSIEDDVRWLNELREQAPANLNLAEALDPLIKTRKSLKREKYDVIVIDGLDRYQCAELSLDLVSDDGCVVLDNAEGYWGAENEYPILELFRHHKYQRVEFFGYVPGIVNPQCTAIFYKDKCFLFAGKENIVVQ